MKKFELTLFIVSFAICSMLSSCLKDKANPTLYGMSNAPQALVGTWSLVNDSTTITPWGIWQGMPITGANYIGKTGDYYQFTANNMVYYSENGQKDTATYAIKKNYLYFGYTTTYGKDTAVYQFGSTGEILTLKGDTAVSPEQVFSHIINLKQ